MVDLKQVLRAKRLTEEMAVVVGKTKASLEQSKALLARTIAITSQLHALSNSPTNIAASVPQDNVIPFPASAYDAAGFYFWDLHADRVYGDRAVADLFDLEFRQVSGGLPLMSFIDRIHPDDQPIVARSIRISVMTGAPYLIEYRVLNRWGAVRIAAYGRCFRKDGGEPAFWSGILHRA